MHLQKFVFSILAGLFCLLSTAQKSAIHTNSLYDYQHGLELYEEGAYQSAQSFFNKALLSSEANLSVQENCNYYIAMSSVKLNKKEGEAQMLRFVKNYPTSKRKNTAYLEVGNHYYTHGKPAASLKWFQKASPKYLTNQQEEDYNFKLGYALFSNKKYTQAKQYFLPLTHTDTYLEEANYYYGYISYLQEDYATALQYFKKLDGNKRYQKEILYYLMNIQFTQKKYNEVVENGKKLLKISSKRQVSEISKIIGESYFYLGTYTDAITYLKKYRGKKNRLTTTDHYFLGYAYYKEADFKNAIPTFNKITKGKDEVAQNAYYHLAACYLQLNKKSEALNAFKNSSEMDFNQEIKEDAAYNYAKLSYEIGNPYESTPIVLQNFVQKYPNSSKTAEINKLIINSYISSKDYEGALAYYKKRHLSLNASFQKISLYRAIQLFQSSDYRASLKYFNTASNQIFDTNIQARAVYWKAEAYYRLHQYKQALGSFKRFQNLRASKKTQEFINSAYSIGYTYFKLKEYQKAKTNFESFLRRKNIDPIKKNDSYVRLGDCNFISKSYWNAMEAYNKVIDKRGIDADYAAYQKAISYGFVRRNDKKIETLKSFSKKHPKSSYKDDALYELGNAYINAKQNSNAISAFDNLIGTHKRSVYIPKALLKQGLIYFNENNSNAAIKKYKYIVKTYPKSKEAHQAVANARQVYVDIDKVDVYADWIRSINYTNISDADLDDTMYEAAELKYLANNLPQAISSFKKYLINFPEGLHSLNAHFYSGQANFSKKNTEKAATHYQYVVALNSNEYTEQSLARLAQIYLEKNAWIEATPILERLEQEANFPQNILFAQSNLMKGSYEKDAYKQTVAYAEKVLENKKVDDQVKSDAYVYIARSAFKTKDLKKAEKAYKQVSKLAKGILKAEALYYDAYFKHLAKKHEASNKTVQTLAADYAAYKYWGVKGLLLMAKNNDGLNDAFQATYILESIVKNYPQFEDLVQEAQTTLDAINLKNKKTEKSVKESSDATDF